MGRRPASITIESDDCRRTIMELKSDGPSASKAAARAWAAQCLVRLVGLGDLGKLASGPTARPGLPERMAAR